jgi:transporter family-2 protein
MSDTAFVMLALVAGAFLATQGLINGKLNAAFSSPLIAALISFCVGLACLVFINTLLIASGKVAMPRFGMAAGLPWWAWIGGILGACIVALAAAAVPRLGAATYISAIICGQLASAAMLDHIGAFGYAARPLSAVKLLGIACMAGGVYLIRKG